MILYLTYNDQPSGVYWSQVTDVVAHLNTLGGPRVRLVALVSARGFRNTRDAIRAHSPGAWVLPMVPTMRRWRGNTGILAAVCRWLRPTGIICRGPFATAMAVRMRERGLVRKVCYDGRGAYAAEWEEYRIIDDAELIAQVPEVERQAVQQADLRIAVSRALVAHWQQRYAYVGDRHVVVPCTLGTSHVEPPEVGRVPDGRVTLVYSGSTAGWQSFELLEHALGRSLEEQPALELLFLSRQDANNIRLAKRFPERVRIVWLQPEAVAEALAEADHGVLLRERTVTNQVASPTKFAEYLAAGLRVVVSEHIGDLSDLVREADLGVVLAEGQALPELAPVGAVERVRLQRFAREHFTKAAYEAEYRSVLAAMSA